ncbi:MAG: SAM-dependent methyltransferase [Bacteroidales bacterium]|nr:SAM-dependent methyltransferase [Bacteroidales bacterium]
MSKIYLIPNTLGNTKIDLVIPKQVQEITKSLRFFFVENLRSARRYLRKVDPTFPIDDSTFFDIGKGAKPQDIKNYFNELKEDAGIISESGMPAVADPGAKIVGIARQKGFDVVPLVGPSSILLALSASGFNGQNFAFHGYLPIEKGALITKIKELEKSSRRFNQTQIFIETPFRNNTLFDALIRTCSTATQLCIAKEITTSEEEIINLPISQWKTYKIDITKKNTIYLLHSYR